MTHERYLLSATPMPGEMVEALSEGYGDTALRMQAAGLDGAWGKYWNNGQLFTRKTWKNGREHGKSTMRYPNSGRIEWLSVYVEGEKVYEAHIKGNL